jgi:glycosyltransferase involved in cell wall biosynthesis
MKILLVSQYFYPEPFIINDLVKTLVEHGHEVVVYTGKPNYPEGEIYEGFEANGFVEDKFNGNVKVYRVPLRPRHKSGAKNLVLNYLSFIYSGIKYSSRIKENNFDVIFSFGLSPITAVIPAIYIKYKFKKRLTLWVQDLWPESLVATGYIKNKFLLYPITLLVKWIYRNCDQILVQSKGFKIPVSHHTQKELIYYPNSIKVEKNKSLLSLPSKLSETLKNNFCLVFAGNLGKAQALEVILDAAENLRDLKKFKIIFVGSGSLSKWLQIQKEKRNLFDIELPGRFPMDMMPVIYEEADGLIVSLRDNKIINYTIPSKIQSYLSSGKPIIGTLNGEGAKVILESESGYVSEAGCPKGLEVSIRKLYHLNRDERVKLGQKGLEFFNLNFDMKEQAKNLIEILSGKYNR